MLRPQARTFEGSETRVEGESRSRGLEFTMCAKWYRESLEERKRERKRVRVVSYYEMIPRVVSLTDRSACTLLECGAQRLGG